MKKINTIYEEDIFPQSIIKKHAKYSGRKTVKALVIDSNQKIALIGNRKNDYLQLPGGGVNQRESIRKALVRECLEETGCKVKIISKVGIIDDYRSRDNKHCITHCYISKVILDTKKQKYTRDEKNIGAYIKWFSFNDTKKIFKNQNNAVKSGKVNFYNTAFNLVRDYMFLQKIEKWQIE